MCKQERRLAILGSPRLQNPTLWVATGDTCCTEGFVLKKEKARHINSPDAHKRSSVDKQSDCQLQAKLDALLRGISWQAVRKQSLPSTTMWTTCCASNNSPIQQAS